MVAWGSIFSEKWAWNECRGTATLKRRTLDKTEKQLRHFQRYVQSRCVCVHAVWLKLTLVVYTTTLMVSMTCH